MADITKDPHGHETKPKGGHDESNSQVAWERRDVDVFQISAFGIGLLLSCLVVVFGMWAAFNWMFRYEDSKNKGTATESMRKERPALPPEPRLQGNPRQEIKDLQGDEDTILKSFGWIDPAKGTVRIPVALAIDLVAKKGLPSKLSPAGTANDGYRMIPADSSGGTTLEKIAQ